MKCTYCKDTGFITKEDYRQHFKDPWHVDNVKRKSKGMVTLNHEEWKIDNFNQNYK